MEKLQNNELTEVVGGLANPVSGMSYKNAMKRAKSLGKKRKNMGTWSQMNETDFLRWWRSSNLDSDEYKKNKEEIDALIGEVEHEDIKN